jgi:hypothetical protein
VALPIHKRVVSDQWLVISLVVPRGNGSTFR